jgi:hypothetical protein
MYIPNGADYLNKTRGEQAYFDLVFRDTNFSSRGSTYIVLVRFGTTGNDPTPELGGDCAFYEELNSVIDRMIEDLNRLRKRGKKHFAHLQSVTRELLR